MKVEEFYEHLLLDVQTYQQMFIMNMLQLKVPDRSFEQWLQLFIKWMEWVEEEGNVHYRKEEYPDLDYDD